MSATENQIQGSTVDRAAAQRFGRAARIALLIIIGLYAAARFWRLTASCLWFDELFSVHAARHAWGDLLGFVAADVIHPPLFYALLKIWIALGGETLLWLRSFAVLVSLACIIPFLLLCRELRLKAVETNLALLLMAASGYLIKYAQEVRMYSLMLLLALFSLWLFVRLLRAADAKVRGVLFALFAVNLLLVYTHYYGWLVVATQFLFVVATRRRLLLRFFLTTVLLVVCFAPWLYALAVSRDAQGRGIEQNLGWVARPSPLDAARFVSLLHEPFYFRQSSNEPVYLRWSEWAVVVFIIPAMLFALRVFKRDEDARQERELFLLLLAHSFTPVALAFVASRVLPQSVWGTRHLIIAAAPMLLLSGVALARVRRHVLRTTLLVAASCWFLWGAVFALARTQGRYIWCGWENLTTEMQSAEPSKQTQASVPVYAFEDLVAYHVWFAVDGARDERFKVAVVKGVAGLAEDPAYFLPRGFDAVRVVNPSEIDDERCWILFRDFAWTETRPPLKILRERGYQFSVVGEFDAQGQKAFLVLARR